MWQPATTRGPRARIALATIIILSAATIGALAYGPQEAAADSGVELGGLQGSGVNETLDGNLSNIEIAASINYDHDVPDATRRVVELHVGPSESEMTNVGFLNEPEPEGEASGSVDIEASLFDADGFEPGDFQPDLAESETTTVVVQAVVEVRRDAGGPERSTVTEEFDVTLHDDATLTVESGGTVSLSVVDGA